MYVTRFRLLVGLGVVLLPISVLITLLQAFVLHATNVVGVQTGGEGNGVLVFFVVALSTTLALLGLGLVQAATARALTEIDQGNEVGAVRAYRLALGAVGPLFGALLIAVITVSLLASSVFLLPLAIWLAGRWALIAPVVALEHRSALGALWRSNRLVRRRWLKVSSLIVVGGALVLVAGPLLGTLLIVLTSAPFWLVNLIAGLVYMVAMPFVALATAYAYFDARVRTELELEREAGPLPAEIELPDEPIAALVLASRRLRPMRGGRHAGRTDGRRDASAGDRRSRSRRRAAGARRRMRRRRRAGGPVAGGNRWTVTSGRRRARSMPQLTHADPHAFRRAGIRLRRLQQLQRLLRGRR